MSNFIKDEINEVDFVLRKAYMKKCIILAAIIMSLIALINCFIVEFDGIDATNNIVQYAVMYVTLFIGVLPMAISFINDTKWGFYVSILLNAVFWFYILLEQGKFWYVVIIISVPILAITRFILNIIHRKIKIKPENEPEDPEDKLPYNDLETAESDSSSDDDGDGDDDMSGEGDIDLED